tara:strand:- start:751 stop:1104 length:354 start_codon:yes stop_codon:yes gene_type:complete
MNKIGKYEFTNESTAKSKIAALGTITYDGNTYPAHDHCVVELGNIVLTPGDYDEEGNELEAPVVSEMYHVDVLWKNLIVNEDGNLEGDHNSWDSYKVDVDDEGFHSFLGLSYVGMKL